MGAYAPTPVMPADLLARVQAEVLEPTLKGLRAKGISYQGVLYAGLIITPGGRPQGD